MPFKHSQSTHNRLTHHAQEKVIAKPVQRIDFRRCLICFVYLLFALLILSYCGCGKKELEKIKKEADKAISSVNDTVGKTAADAKKQLDSAVQKATDTVQEAVGGGSISLTINSVPVPCKACFANFIEQAPDRPNVLKFQSHLDMKTPKFPAALIQIQTDSPLDKLSGQTAEAIIYFQEGESSPIWFSDEAETVQIKITSISDDKIKADVIGGKLQSSDGESITAAGSIEGILQ